jgi:uncharacterized membrane protein YkvA (DUF1232 family)
VTAWHVRARQWALTIRRDATALYLASRDPRVPWYAKVAAVTVAAYALSPIDLIPDFVPVLGYLDDVVILPLGILAAVWLIPPNLMAEFRAEASRPDRPPMLGRIGAGLMVTVWIVGVVLVVRWLWPYLGL